MNKGIMKIALPWVLLVCGGVALAQNPGHDKDVFKGKLFAPDVILEHREALELSEQQLSGIRAAVIDVQSNIAEYQWDLRDAYQRVLSDLDAAEIDEERVLEHVSAALAAENKVKKMQVGMLIRLRNLLTEEQVAYLKSVR
jgi:hypothetical protein